MNIPNEKFKHPYYTLNVTRYCCNYTLNKNDLIDLLLNFFFIQSLGIIKQTSKKKKFKITPV